MKNYFGILALGLMLFIQSCEKENVVNQNESSSTVSSLDQLETFKGLPVNHRFSTPIKELEEEHTVEFLEREYNYKLREALNREGVSGRNTEVELPDGDVIVDAVNQLMEQFPFQSDENNIEELTLEELQSSMERSFNEKNGTTSDVDNSNMVMIKDDFPTLTEEEIKNNILLIDEYYSKNLDNEVLTVISNNSELRNRKSINKRMADGLYEDKEKCVLEKVAPHYGVVKTIFAGWHSKDESERLAKIYFAGKGEENTMRDSFRHMLWNALMCKYYPTVSSKQTCINFAILASQENENCRADNPIHSLTMDYHNNEIGRFLFSYFCSDRTFLGATVGLDKPSQGTLTIACYNFARVGRFIDPKSFPNDGNQKQNIVNEIYKTYTYQPVYFDKN